jgi:hypothetical protein
VYVSLSLQHPLLTHSNQVLCNETAVNPEIQAISQHQDPASANAAATNKAIVLELAKQLASIGADPQEALLSGTFAPGNVSFPMLLAGPLLIIPARRRHRKR